MTNVSRMLIGGVCLCLGFACEPAAEGAGGDELKAAVIKKRDPTKVRVEPAVRREMLRVLETTTRVESEHQVEVMARAAGMVVELFVEEGAIVESGEVLARLDARETAIALSDAEVALEDAKASEPRLDLAVREAEAKLASSKRTLEQAQRDFDRNAAIAQAGPDRPALLSPKDLDASRLARDNAQADTLAAELALERAKFERENGKTAARRAQLAVDRARLNHENMTLTAPFAGVLASRSIEVGDSLNMNASAFTLTDRQHLRAVFYRPQREFALFTTRGEGPTAAEVELFATAEALPGKRFRGAIKRISPTIDPQSGNFRVTAELQTTAVDDPSAHLYPGMLVRLEIVTERRPNTLVVPKRAVRREGDTNLVFVAHEGRARRVTVDEGLSDDDYVEVLPREGSALEAGEAVIVVGNRDLEDGAEVAITLDAAPAATPAPTPDAEAPAPSDSTAGSR